MTRLLGQSPAGLSATGDSDTRNTYDMIAARQAIDLRPQLERLDRILLRSAGVDPAALSECQSQGRSLRLCSGVVRPRFPRAEMTRDKLLPKTIEPRLRKTSHCRSRPCGDLGA